MAGPESEAVPATVIPVPLMDGGTASLNTLGPLPLLRRGGKALKDRESQETCQNPDITHSFRVKSCGEEPKTLLCNIPEKGCDKIK